MPPPDLTVSQWADRYRRLSPEASAEPGHWNTDRASYQRGILDALNDPDVHTIVVMSSAQVGKTEVLLNIIGYYVDQDPAPMLCLQPTLDMAEAFSKDRLAPMVRDTPALRGKIADPRSRDSGNTLLHKKFTGGHITLAGGNSPASLASRPIRILLCDEVDRYPASAAAEGDPVNLARKRTTTFWNRKIVLTSTPTIKGVSRIETAYNGSDQRKYHLNCPHCDDSAPLNWDRVKWQEEAPKSAVVICAACGVEWSDAERKRAIAGGQWVAGAEFSGIAGFHLSEIYSPWSSPGAMAVAFIEAKQGGTEMLQTWINTSLGETWEEKGEGADWDLLMERQEVFAVEVPADALILTAGIDVQKDRIEFEVVGWAESLESWSVDYVVLPGETTQSQVWEDLAEALKATYHHESGSTMRIAGVCIDSGYLAKAVYDFVLKFRAEYVYAVKGIEGQSRPIIESMSQRARRLAKRKSKKIRPELIGVDEAKTVLMRRLKIAAPGPGYCHFPVERDEEYFLQLTAEQLITRHKKGRPVREWRQVRHRNEALDCRVYAHAALLLADPDWGRLNKKQGYVQQKPIEKSTSTMSHRRPMRQRARR